MKNATVLAALALSLLPIAAIAAPAHKAKAAAKMYECQKCHMKYSAADAKKDHYKDPMDGGKLMPVASSGKKAASSGMKM